MLAYFTMFCTMFDLITIDYIVQYKEYIENHASISETT